MFSRKNDRERERFYLLPGQGGSNYRRRRRHLLVLAVLTGLFIAGVMSVLMWYFTRLNR